MPSDSLFSLPLCEVRCGAMDEPDPDFQAQLAGSWII